MKRRGYPALLILIFLFVATVAEAQRFTTRSRYSSLGLSLNAMNYFGDIVPDPTFTSFRVKSTRPNIAASMMRRYTPRTSARASLSWGRIMGDDVLSASESEAENMGRYMRNLSFRNDIIELHTAVVFDLFENRFSFHRRPDFVPYGFIGIAGFYHNPKAYYINGSHPGIGPEDDIPTGWYALQPIGTEGQYVTDSENKHPSPYSRFQIAIPFGLGVRYKLDSNWDLSFELGWRKTFTDYLDDASGRWVDKIDLLNGGGTNPKAAAILSDRSGENILPGYEWPYNKDGQTPYTNGPHSGTYENRRRGNPSDKDWYIVSGLTINYILTPNVRSPKFR